MFSTTSPTRTTYSASPLAMNAAGLADFSSNRPTNRNGIGGAVGGGGGAAKTGAWGSGGGGGGSQPFGANGSLAADSVILVRVGRSGAACGSPARVAVGARALAVAAVAELTAAGTVAALAEMPGWSVERPTGCTTSSPPEPEK